MTEDKKHRIRLELSTEEHDAFRVLAAQRRLSMSALALFLVRDAIVNARPVDAAPSPENRVSTLATSATNPKPGPKAPKRVTTKS